jgi:predicted ATP-grasp superfamily ATP-dependent carboligase
MLFCIENFMKERTLTVAVGNTISNEAAIENGVVQGAVLSVTLFLLAMSEICDGIHQEPVKIIGYADDWMILTSHKHVRTSENLIQKAMHQITKWADNTGFQISILSSLYFVIF